MSRIIRNQTLASTHVDRSGDRIPRGGLRELYEQLSQQTMSGVMHDVSRPPIARMVGKRLVETEDGELAIKVDYEILDEAAFAEIGGYSSSFIRSTWSHGTGEPAFRILVNPAQFSIEELRKDLVAVVPSGIAYYVSERIEKGIELPDAVVILFVWMAGEVLKGFFSSVGAALFDRLRAMRRKDTTSGRTAIQIHLMSSVNRDQSAVVLVIPTAVEGKVLAGIDLDELDTLTRQDEPRRYVGTVSPSGEVTLTHYVRADQSTQTLDSLDQRDVEPHDPPSEP